MDDPAEGRVVVCRVANERFALPVAAVRQIVAAPPVTRLPGAPQAVGGIANAHGMLVTTVSAPRLLGLPAPAASEWLIVLAMGEGRIGLEVDEVEDVGEGSETGLRMLDLEALIRPLLA
jgi:purine-binding chemotaxis protein CheW